MFDTPILLITFNRPRHVAAVLAEIKKQQPKFLFVFQDGPRSSNPEDKAMCMAVRELISKEVDWICELKTLFEETNLGCGYGPAKAITWFFENVEQGIILEDDCKPSADFFRFCAEMLCRFRNDSRISVISGTNPLVKWKSNSRSYIFSKFGSTWGWASWERAWENFDHSIEAWDREEGKLKIKKFLSNEKYYSYYFKEFDRYSNPERRKDVWDFHWLFCRFILESYSIVPSKNLISNIGFGTDAHHTFNKNDLLSEIIIEKLQFPLKEHIFKIDKVYDWIVFERFINPKERSLSKKIYLKAVKTFFRIK